MDLAVNLNAPAREENIKYVEEKLGLELPQVYKEFLLKANGACFNDCIVYGTGDIIERYECGFLDAGAIGTAEPEERFVFEDWLEQGCTIKNEQVDLSKEGKVLLVKVPEDKLKGLTAIKKVFDMKVSTGVLLKETKELPYVVTDNMVHAKALKLMEQTGFAECFRFVEGK